MKCVAKCCPLRNMKATADIVVVIKERGVDVVTSDPSSKLESTVKSLLRERSMSMRQLAKMTGINVGTISKMVTGKQRVNPEYLQRMAQCLAVPTDILFTAAGFDVGNQAQFKPSYMATLDMMHDVIQYLGIQSQCFTKSNIERELDKYESYAKTAEGQELIVEKYLDKRKQITGSGQFVDDLDEMYDRFVQNGVSGDERAILGSGLLYFVLATDAIPDYMFPIGYFDDVLAVQMTRKRLTRLQECTSKNSDALE